MAHPKVFYGRTICGKGETYDATDGLRDHLWQPYLAWEDHPQQQKSPIMFLGE